MNSTNNTVTVMIADFIIEEVYENYVFISVVSSATILAFYVTLTNLSQEIEYMWLKPFSLPTLLYIFARYGILICQGLKISLIFMSSGRSCNILANAANTAVTLNYIGIQGLLIIRAYSLCQANKILISALAFVFVSAFGVNLYGIIAFPGCATNSSISPVTGKWFMLISVWLILKICILVADILTISTDLLIFGICLWKVWGTWRLKCESGIQSGRSLTSILLSQSILRCCFVVTITVAGAIIGWVPSLPQSLVTSSYVFVQNVLSATLVADFTLDLRRLNSAKIQASQISLPTLRFSNALQHAHQSFLVEMATPEERNVTEEEGGGHDHDNFPGSMDFDIQPAEA